MKNIEMLSKTILRRYLLGLSLIALLSTGSFLTVYHLISLQKDSAKVVNISGRQRMLSQRIALLSEIIVSSQNTEDKDRRKYRADLISTLDLFRSSHLMLSGKGDVRQGIIPNSPEVDQLYFQAPIAVDYFSNLYIEEITNLLAGDVKVLPRIRLMSQSILLDRLDAVVSLHQLENEKDIATIELTEMTIFALTLSLLLFEAFFIFQPMRKSTVNLFNKLTEAREIAVRATDEKSTFLATITHEIRTPMIGVQGIAGILLESNLDAIQESQIKTVQRISETLILLVNDILDYSKFESGKMLIEELPLNLNSLLIDNENLFFAVAAKKSINFAVSIDPEIEPDRIGDSMRINQVLSNFVSNALKFTSKDGSIAVKIIKLPENAIRFEVEDSGIGLTEDQIQRLFSRYVQADETTARKFGGTGLGLAICKQIVELMNGQIGVESELGKGSTFWFTLDLKVNRKDKHSKLVSEGAFVWEGKRILVAEDNVVIQKVASHLLKKIGLVVTIASDGFEALEVFKADRFDFVFLDCEMPNMDGFEAAREIRKIDRQIPILAMSAHISEDIRLKCLNAGMNDFLTKPMKINQVVAALERWIQVESRQSRQAG